MKIHNLATIIGTALLSVAGGMLVATQTNAHHIDLGWKGSPYTLKLNKSENLGKEYNFECVPAPEFIGQTMAVIGTDNYSEWSNICPSALHAGIISRDGGFVTIKIEPGKEFYTATERNGIKSKNAGASEVGFSFVGNSAINSNISPNSSNSNNEPTTGNLRREVEEDIKETLDGLF